MKVTKLNEELDHEMIFPDSKITTTLYNGSDIDFTELDFNKVNIHDDGYLGEGFYLTQDKDYALSYGNILKSFYIDTKNPFCFNNISIEDRHGLIEAIVKYYKEKIPECANFIYWLVRKSNDDTLKYCAKKFTNNNIHADDFVYVLELILDDPDAIYDGALMDFSKVITPYIKSKGYDSCYISAEGHKYQEVVIYDPKQVYLIEEQSLTENIADITKYWSKETAHPAYREKYDQLDKSAGQCAATALLVNDLYGYDIYDVMVGRNRHFFNLDNNGNVIDLTASQFRGKTIPYSKGRLRDKKDLLKINDVRERYTLLKNRYIAGEN